MLSNFKPTSGTREQYTESTEYEVEKSLKRSL